MTEGCAGSAREHCRSGSSDREVRHRPDRVDTVMNTMEAADGDAVGVRTPREANAFKLRGGDVAELPASDEVDRLVNVLNLFSP